MLVLQSFPPALGLRSPSPFTVKVEALLAMSGLPYEVRHVSDPRKAPRGKLPVLLDGDRVVPDSAHIQRHLEEHHGVDFDGALTDAEQATATAFRRLIEHHFYFIAGNLRWNMHPEAVRDAYFGDMPVPVRRLVFPLILRGVNKTARMQGLGRHTREELIRFAAEDIDAVAAQLGDRPFFLGERPTSIDASLYGMLHTLLDCELRTPLVDEAERHPNLRPYADRMTARLFP